MQGFVSKTISQSNGFPGALNILTVSLTFNFPVTNNAGAFLASLCQNFLNVPSNYPA